MKFVQEFEIAEPVEALWAFFDRPEIVAESVPGFEQVTTVDPETFLVVVTQSVGPISATFEARLHVVEKVEHERIAFNATGKAVRGAIGNFRAESVVRLFPRGEHTLVQVETEAALAGVLGSVGQKVISRQAEKVAAQFARNLEARLGGSTNGEASDSPDVVQPAGRPVPVRSASRPRGMAAGNVPVIVVESGWSKVAAALGAVNLVVMLMILFTLS